MTLLTPLGLLGLIGLVVWLIIYLIKPNYQQKMISSTYIWKLSLKYRKKKIPISKLRNILLILCQILAITACSLILAQPNEILRSPVKTPEVIAIIDASASMRTNVDGETRFERAVNCASELSDSILNKNGHVSVILASTKSAFLAQRVTLDNREQVEEALELLDGDSCSYGVSDVEGAIELCEEVLEVNPDAKIYFYTDTTYSYVPDGITVEVDSIIDEQNEWNAAILDATAERIENYYAFNVDVARYGESGNMEVRVEVQNANAMDSSDVGATIVFSEVVFCENAQPIRVIFTNEDRVKENEANVVYVPIAMQDRIYAYQSIHISLNENDSFSEDNSFNIYNGQKEVVKVQYYSAGPNPFFTSGLSLLRSNFADRWDVQVTEVKKGGEFALEGFDFYVFEHSMPEKMPEDGVVFLVNPDFRFGTAPAGSGIQLKDEIMTFSNGASLEANVDTHPIVNYLPLNTIQITALSLLSYDTDYEVLATCANEPALLVKNQAKEKVVVMPFSVHYSDVAINIGLPTLIYNVFSYFFPSTLVSGSNAAAVEVYESVELTGRGTELYISRGAETLYTYTEFPAVLRLDKPGTYSITQTTIFEKNVTESIYVKIPSQESDIFKEDEALRNPYATQEDVDYYEDLLLYFAIALVALLFCEWWLQSREQV